MKKQGMAERFKFKPTEKPRESKGQLSEANLKAGIKMIMVLRVVITITLLFGLVLFIHINPTYQISFFPFYIFLIIFSLTLLYGLLLDFRVNLVVVAIIQLIIDTVLITILVYATGGLESICSILYIIIIIEASFLLGPRSAYGFASLSFIGFGFIIDTQHLGILNPPVIFDFAARESTWYNVAYKLMTNFVAFYASAYLSNYIARRFRSTWIELEEKKKTYEKLQSFNQEILNNINSGIITIDSNGKVIYANPTAIKLLNIDMFDSEDLFIEQIFKDKSDQINEQIRKAVHDQGFYENWFKLDNDTSKYLSFLFSPFPSQVIDEAKVLCIFNDFTRLKELQEQMHKREQLAAIGEMGAGIAHEIRNPLGSITGSIEVLASELNLNELNKRLMDIVLRESKRLNNLVEAFLRFARPAPLTFIDINLCTILREIKELILNDKSYPQNVEIVLDFGDKETYIWADSEQIRQVFWNLCTNAMDAMPNGGKLTIVLRSFKDVQPINEVNGVRFEKPAFNGDLVAIAFIDTGSGIEADRIPKVFLPFHSQRSGGLGLGLAIANRIVNQHGGEIRVNSQPGKGSVFTVYLPKRLYASVAKEYKNSYSK